MSQNTDATALLMAARMLITDEAAWTQERFARDAFQAGVPPTDLTASCWCSDGALLALCSNDWSVPYIAAYNRLRDAMSENPPEFNDFHTHAEVLAAFDKAIEAA